MVGRREERSKELEEELKQEEKKEKKKIFKRKIIKIIILIFVLIIFLFMYMHFVGTKGLKVREYKISSTKLPEKFTGFKIVHFSDLYYLSTIKEKELNNIVNKINELKPDIVVFTGDLIKDKKKLKDSDIKTLTQNLSKIESTIGKYAIKGDNDYSNTYNEIMNNSNFKIINNSYELIYYKDNTPILLTGINSCIKKDCDINSAFSFSGIDNLYTITLMHEPDSIKELINNKPDLVLAGHSLNGKIRLPIIGGIKKYEYAKKYPNSKYKLSDTLLFVSGGLGTNKSELRLFNHPSINLYRLVKETN